MSFRRPQGYAASDPCAMLYFSGSIVPGRLGLAADVTSSGLLHDGRVDAGGSPDVTLPQDTLHLFLSPWQSQSAPLLGHLPVGLSNVCLQYGLTGSLDAPAP